MTGNAGLSRRKTLAKTGFGDECLDGVACGITSRFDDFCAAANCRRVHIAVDMAADRESRHQSCFCRQQSSRCVRRLIGDGSQKVFMDQPHLISGSVLRNAGYRSFAASRVFSSLSFQAVTVAMGWMIYDQTHSAFALVSSASASFCR